jgi:hypothetical protein
MEYFLSRQGIIDLGLRNLFRGVLTLAVKCRVKLNRGFRCARNNAELKSTYFTLVYGDFPSASASCWLLLNTERKQFYGKSIWTRLLECKRII